MKGLKPFSMADHNRLQKKLKAVFSSYACTSVLFSKYNHMAHTTVEEHYVFSGASSLGGRLTDSKSKTDLGVK